MKVVEVVGVRLRMAGSGTNPMVCWVKQINKRVASSRARTNPTVPCIRWWNLRILSSACADEPNGDSGRMGGTSGCAAIRTDEPNHDGRVGGIWSDAGYHGWGQPVAPGGRPSLRGPSRQDSRP